ncbi:phage tail tip lysozyme [Arthrobacter koreensis]|uniref:phage tail tip lysozyme n=1 Tax=Arthrobacter koreensis TaxID=199136 RepID=UPI00382A55AB
MSIPTGGAGGFAKGAGSGAAPNTGVSKAGKDAAASAGENAAPAVGEAVNASGRETGSDLARAGFGSGPPPLGPGAAPGPVPGTGEQVPEALAPAVKMGAGGTSPASPGDAEGPRGANAVGGLGKTAAATAAVPAAGAAGQLAFTLMLLNWMKQMFFGAAAMALNLLNSFIGGALAIGKMLVGGLTAAGAAVSSFLGGAITAGTAAVSVGVTGAMVVGISVASVVTGVGQNNAMREGALSDCSADIVAASKSVDIEPEGGAEAATLANAKLIYGVLSAWGMPDENIAGILGNWDMESGIDPTGVETVSGERFALGPKKQSAEDQGFDVTRVAPEYGVRFPGVKLLGIGLGQWSNDRNTQLRDYAQGEGSWATLETQLGFMISRDSGAPVIKHMIAHPIGSPTAAARYFHDEWERSADTTMGPREAAATRWFARMGGWSKNQALADSILAQAGASLDQANVNRVNNARANCQTDKKTLTAGLKEGGLDFKEAEDLMAVYRSEGESVLIAAFGSGGPGDCGFGKSDNCVGFSSYFMHKFTSFKQYAPGNGIDTAASIARLTDRETSTTPTPYSVFSMRTSAPEGHTGVILGIQGDMAIIGEASCGSNHAGTRAFMQPVSELTSGDYVFTDVSDLLTDEAMA